MSWSVFSNDCHLDRTVRQCVYDLPRKSPAATPYEPCIVGLLFICLTAASASEGIMVRICCSGTTGSIICLFYQAWREQSGWIRGNTKHNGIKKYVGQERYKLGSSSHHTSLVNTRLAAGINILFCQPKGRQRGCESSVISPVNSMTSEVRDTVKGGKPSMCASG